MGPFTRVNGATGHSNYPDPSRATYVRPWSLSCMNMWNQCVPLMYDIATILLTLFYLLLHNGGFSQMTAAVLLTVVSIRTLSRAVCFNNIQYFKTIINIMCRCFPHAMHPSTDTGCGHHLHFFDPSVSQVGSAVKINGKIHYFYLFNATFPHIQCHDVCCVQ